MIILVNPIVVLRATTKPAIMQKYVFSAMFLWLAKSEGYTLHSFLCMRKGFMTLFLLILFKIIFHIISHYLVSIYLLNCRFYLLPIHVTPLHSYNILPPPPYLTLSPPTKSFPLQPQHSCYILFQLSNHIVIPYYFFPLPSSAFN